MRLVLVLVSSAACGRVSFDDRTDALAADAARIIPSCESLAPTCGPTADGNCCDSPLVPGGTFLRGNDRGTDARFGDTAHAASVSSVRLDRYEVSVGRFRAYLAAGQGTQAAPPASGDGAHAGMAWDPSWNPSLAPNDAMLRSGLLSCTFATWTNAPDTSENRPINCITWYEAFAFCAWDGGFLPTEAEWSYVAAGGDEQRAYPWSVPPSSLVIDTMHASYYDTTLQCIGDGMLGCAPTDIVPVGSKPAGDGRWGQSDLAGNLWEHTLDYYGTFPQPCADCVNATPDANRVLVSGGYDNDAISARAMERYAWLPADRHAHIGIRCARLP